jgi:hypothetical protein
MRHKNYTLAERYIILYMLANRSLPIRSTLFFVRLFSEVKEKFVSRIDENKIVSLDNIQFTNHRIVDKAFYTGRVFFTNIKTGETYIKNTIRGATYLLNMSYFETLKFAISGKISPSGFTIWYEAMDDDFRRNLNKLL